MAPQWLKSLVSRRKRRKGKDDEYDERPRPWKHRKELLDVNRPPLNLLPRVRDLEYPLISPAMIGEQLQQTFEQEQSAFIQLPWDIRDQIYDYLFTNRTIHIHCGFWPGDWRGGRTARDGAYATGHPWQDFEPEIQKLKVQTLPNQWHFFHSICRNDQRFAPKAPQWHCNILRSDAGTYHNQSLYVVSSTANFRSFEPYDPTTLGVMPLLLSCRKL
jgi:hypothetical protein